MNDEISFNLSDESINLLNELRDNAKQSYQMQVVYPNGLKKVFNCNNIKLNCKMYFKKCGKRYKRFLTYSNELIVEGVCYER